MTPALPFYSPWECCIFYESGSHLVVIKKVDIILFYIGKNAGDLSLKVKLL